MTVTIVALTGDHLDAAGRLVAEGAVRSGFPFADEGLQDAVTGALAHMDLDAGVVALRDRRVVGFLVGFPARLFNGLPGVHVPEWGHAVDGDPSVYGPLYRAASQRWVAAGRLSHALSLFSGDGAGLESWSGMDFGRHLIDGVRRVVTAARPSTGVAVRLAVEADLEAAAALEEATAAHLRAAPVFLARRPDDHDALLARLGDPQRPVFVAETDDRVVGWLTASPSEDSSFTLRRHVPLAIDGAFVEPARRGAGIGTILVESMVAWAAAEGFEWIAVDYETANFEAAAFWPRCGFDPVLVSLARTIVIPDG